jgi:hypothetical protein
VDHLSWDDVWAYVDGDRTANESTLAHLRLCVECSERWNQAWNLHESLVTAFTESVPNPSEDAVDRLLTTLRPLSATTAGPSPRRLLKRWTLLTSGVAAAAVIAIAAGLGLHGTSDTGRVNSASSTVAMGGDGGSVANAAQSSTPPTSASTQALQSAAQAPTAAWGNSVHDSADESVSAVMPSMLAATDADERVAKAAVPQVKEQTVFQGQVGQSPKPSPNATGSSSLSPAALMGPATVAGAVQVRVVNPAGQPLPNVHVALLTNGQVQTSVVTDGEGKTPSVDVQVPQDPLLLGTFTAPAWPPQGVITVVAWKDGYQPQVYYGLGVFAFGSTTYNVQLTMTPATTGRVRISGDGAQGDYGLRMWDGFVCGAERMVQSAVSTGQVNERGAGDAELDFIVKDEDGKPVAQAEVAVIAGGRITGYGITSASGRVSVDASGIPDWRTVDGTPIAGIAVLKDGFVPAVGLMQPVPSGARRDILVRMESVAWRAAHHGTDANAPTEVPGMCTPSQAEAEQVYNLAVSSGDTR